MGLLARRRFLVCNWSMGKELRFLQCAPAHLHQKHVGEQARKKCEKKRKKEKTKEKSVSRTSTISAHQKRSCMHFWMASSWASRAWPHCCVSTAKGGEKGPQKTRKMLNVFLASLPRHAAPSSVPAFAAFARHARHTSTHARFFA